MKEHRYETNLEWEGNKGEGTSGYRAYGREYEINVTGKAQPIIGSSDPAFLGDPTRYNPEELLVASISSCHMLWYLHLCASNGIIVNNYSDKASGLMTENPDGSGQFSEVVLYPEVEITNKENTQKAIELHQMAHEKCFIARSCNFQIKHRPKITVTG